MIRNLIIRYHRLAKPFDFNIAAVVRTEGNGRIDDVRNQKHSFVKIFLIGFFQLLECGQAFIVGLDGGHIGVNFCLNGGFFFLGGLLQFAEERSVCLAEPVSLCAQFACLSDSGAVFCIQINDLIHQRKLCVLIFLSNIFLYNIRVFPNKSDIEHFFLLLFSYY